MLSITKLIYDEVKTSFTPVIAKRRLLPASFLAVAMTAEAINNKTTSVVFEL
jgi:hypothetical protein